MAFGTRAIVATALAAGLGVTAAAQPPVAKKDAPVAAKDTAAVPPVAKKDAPAAKEVAVVTVVKVFDLKNANPADVQVALVKHIVGAAPDAKGTDVPKAAGRAPFLVAADPKSKSLFVRATAADLEVAAKLVALLDAPAEAGKPSGVQHVHHLQHATAEEVLKVLTALDLAKGVQVMPEVKAIIVLSDPNAEQVKVIVAKLDAPPAPPVAKTPGK